MRLPPPLITRRSQVQLLAPLQIKIRGCGRKPLPRLLFPVSSYGLSHLKVS